MALITKDNVAPFLDINKSLDFSNCDWTRICKSEIFELTIGENEEERNFICFAGPSTDVTDNNIELPQENIMDTSDPMYPFLMEQIKSLPIGEDCQVPFLLCFPDDETGKFANGADAWRMIVTLTGKVLNTPDKKISYSIKKYSDVERGTYSVTEDASGNKVVDFVEATTTP